MNARQQYAALPYVDLGARREVLLITSRRRGRWIIPKGWPEKGLAPHEAAALEAYEEAGVKGRTDPRSIGRYSYIKNLNSSGRVLCSVVVFPLQVNRHLLDFPEKNERKRQWVEIGEASVWVEEPDLAKLLEGFGKASNTIAPLADAPI